MRELTAISEAPFHRVIVDTVALINAPLHDPHADLFWRAIHADVLVKFPTVPPSFTRAEYEAALKEQKRTVARGDIFQVRGVALIERVLTLAGVRISADAKEELRAHPMTFTLVPSDIEEVQARVRHITTIDYSEGMSLALTARTQSGHEKLRLLRLAASKFRTALASSPSSYMSLYQWGWVLLEQIELVPPTQVLNFPFFTGAAVDGY